MNKTLIQDRVYRGHKIMVYERDDGGFQVVSNILDEPYEVEPRMIGTEAARERAVSYIKGYIDGWKNAGGP